MFAKSTNKHITLKGYTFKLYNLDNFEFNEQIEIKGITEGMDGVYVFTRKYNAELREEPTAYFVARHVLLYLGKAKSVEGRPLSPSHDKWKKLKSDGCNRVGIYLCKDDENPKTIESIILDAYDFKENRMENDSCTGLPTNVAEDPEGSLVP